MCPHYLTSARCPCTALTKRIPRVLPPSGRGSDGDSGADEDDDNDTHAASDQFHLFLIRADDTERHAAYHYVDRLTGLLSLLAEDIESEIGASPRILEELDKEGRKPSSERIFSGRGEAFRRRELVEPEKIETIAQVSQRQIESMGGGGWTGQGHYQVPFPRG
jgi:hypothetical protein